MKANFSNLEFSFQIPTTLFPKLLLQLSPLTSASSRIFHNKRQAIKKKKIFKKRLKLMRKQQQILKQSFSSPLETTNTHESLIMTSQSPQLQKQSYSDQNEHPLKTQQEDIHNLGPQSNDEYRQTEQNFDIEISDENVQKIAFNEIAENQNTITQQNSKYHHQNLQKAEQVVRQIVNIQTAIYQQQSSRQPQKEEQTLFLSQLCLDKLQQSYQFEKPATEQLIIYQHQFTHIHHYVTQKIAQKLQPKSGQEISFTRVIIAGDPQCGKKHLINQVIDRLAEQEIQTGSQTVNVVAEKLFVNQMTLGYLRDEVKELKDTGIEESNKDSNQGQVIKVECLIVDRVLGQGSQLIEKYLHHQAAKRESLHMVVYCLNYENLANLSKQSLNNSILVYLPSFSPQNQYPPTSQIPQKPFQDNYNQTTKSQLVKQLHQLLINQVVSVEQYINQILLMKSKGLKKCRVECSQSVRNFTIKMLVKKYEVNYPEVLHPIVAIKYLGNYLKSYFKAQLINPCDSEHFQSNQLPQSEPQSQQTQLNLASTTVAHFFNHILSSTCSNLKQPAIIQQIGLTSLIMGLQLVLISCFLYLDHPQYFNSLYIHAVKLYPFFVMTSKSITLQPYQQRAYWDFLQKLKEKGLIKFVVDVGNKYPVKKNKDHFLKEATYMATQKKYKRKDKKLRFIRDYKNHNFILLISKDKIKDELSELQIYKKFFIP